MKAIGVNPLEQWCLAASASLNKYSYPFVPGFIKEDPKLPEDKILPPPSPRPQNSIFDTDEEKSKVNVRVLMPAPTLICTDETTALLYLGSFCSFRQSIFRTTIIFLLYDSQRIL